jgi:2-oxoisovalerate dehydrogenase E2 component (dihydrolipoyl transacylase)
VQRDFELPDLGEGLEEATVVEWHVQPGDHVTLNDTLCDIETAKAEVELPSPFTGTVLVTNGRPGETLRVGELLIRFELDETTVAAPEEVDAAVGGEAAERTPTLVGYGVREASTTKRVRRQWPRRYGTPADGPRRDAVPSAPATTAGRAPATPPVRKLAKDLGVDIATVVPTGPRGEITRDDLRAAARGGAEAETAPRSPRARTSSEIAVRGVRARIATRMSVSRSTIPEATCAVWVDCTQLLELRTWLTTSQPVADASGEPAALTPFTIIAWLAVRALQAAPLFNSSFRDERDVIEVHGAVHLGIAADTQQGLMVVVVHDADTLGLSDFGTAMGDLTRRARSGGLTPRELTGSTFTVNNFGALGLDDADPIINHPEAAILGVGSMRPQPAVVGGEIVARPLLKLVAAFDHRVCDGAEAGRYLSRLKELVEQPGLSFPDSGL